MLFDCSLFMLFPAIRKGSGSVPFEMVQILHVAASYNNVEIVRVLLEWNGYEKPELEAKNMYGETPLHMAAKNGCSEAAKLLLSYAAFIEAKANNGMTTLHLAVWHSLRSDDCLTVKTLLEYNVYNADCNAKDDDGMTPLSHLSPGTGNENLRQKLNQYLEKQKKRQALEACSQTKAKMDELELELSNIVGLHELKMQLRKWVRGMLLDERRRALGLKVGTRRPPHMAFLGNTRTSLTKLKASCLQNHEFAGSAGIFYLIIFISVRRIF